jgi:hypothetical protein
LVRRLLALLALLLVSPAAARAASQPPDLEWRTLETTHFYVHYASRNEASARRLAAVAEPVHALLSRDIKWVPDEKTHLLLIDYVDITNGSAIPIPYNTIEIYATPPAPNSALGDLDDWYRLVLTHEYTHILHLDQGFGPAKVTRDLLGRSFISVFGGLPVPFTPFPNFFVPKWMIEGYATLDETRHTTAGRGDSSYTAMVLRMAALDGTFFPLDKGSGEEGEWPGGSFRYLFGEAFLDYLASEHGIEKVNGMFHLNAYGLTPLLIDVPAFVKLDTVLEREWWAWEARVREASRGRLAAVQREGETVPKLLTSEGWETRNPRLAPDGKTLYVTVSNNYSYSHVDALDLATGARRTVFERNSNLGPAVPSRDGRYLYFAQFETYRKFHLYGDVYRFDLRTRNVKRMTVGARILSLDVAPDGAALAAVQNGLGAQALVLYRVAGDKLVRERTLATGERRVFDTPRFSPDGARVAYASWLPGGYVDLFIADRAGHETRLTHDRYLDVAPAFTPAGELLFSSERSGIFNLYRLAATSTTGTAPVRVTNVIGGLFESEPAADGEAYAVSYAGHGFNVARVRLEPGLPTVLLPDRPAFTASYPDSFSAPSEPYAPGATLWPRAWTPIVNWALTPGARPLNANTSPLNGLEAGLAVAGRDVLGFHAYDLTAVYNRELAAPGAQLTYTYDRLTPSLSLSLESMPQRAALRDTGEGPSDAVPGVRTNGAAASVTYPFPHARHVSSVQLAYGFDFDEEFGDLLHAGGPVSRRRGTALVRLRYDSTREFAITFGPQAGSYAALTGRLVAPEFGADYSNAAVLGDARRYVSLPYRQTLALQAQAGVAEKSDFFGPFTLGGLGSRATDTDVGDLPLRGFATGTQDGARIVKAGGEYRFPIWFLKRGLPYWGTFPGILDQLHGALFVEAGSAWDAAPDMLAAAGGELILDFTVGYWIPVSLGVGVAAPLAGGDGSGPTIYVTTSHVNF